MKKVINIFGDITSEPKSKDDVSASMISSQLVGLTSKDQIEINLNTYGGEVFEAVAIASMLKMSQATRIFNILGICASAATMLFQPEDKINIATGAMIMYHKPQVAVAGDAFTLRAVAKRLDKIENENIIKNLVVRTNKEPIEISELIKDEWWLTSDEAIQNLKMSPLEQDAIFNNTKTKQLNIYHNFLEKKKALSNNAYQIFINYKNSMR